LGDTSFVRGGKGAIPQSRLNLGLGDTSFIVREIQTNRTGSSEGGRKTISISINKRKDGPRILITERRNVDGEVENYNYYQNNGYVRSSVTAAFGFNNYVMAGGKFPDAENKWYGLSPLGSRYFSLGWKWGHRFRNSRFGFNYGFEFAWQNFMLQDAYRFTKGRDFVDSIGYMSQKDSIKVNKSKLVQCNIKVPVSVAYRMGKLWYIELGGFVGYRIDSWTKFSYEKNGSSFTDHEYNNNFFLNNAQYGATAQVRRRAWGVFGEYHFNSLFSRGPQLNAFQFGLSFWGI
jgi:hypothetical protein